MNKSTPNVQRRRNFIPSKRNRLLVLTTILTLHYTSSFQTLFIRSSRLTTASSSHINYRSNSNLLSLSTKKSFNEIIPFVIDKVRITRKRELDDITNLCIDVFFNDGKNGARVTPWKSIQLSYLRDVQKSNIARQQDRKARESFQEFQLDMFVARKVVPVDNKQIKKEVDSAEFLPEGSIIYNRETLDKNVDKLDTMYTFGEVIGFCEVKERFLPLPGDDMKKFRPVLTNLSVNGNARRSGVGSALVTVCEETVAMKWTPQYKEMVLQVEEDNISAKEFYEKRGYEVKYVDPTTRKYDTNGFVLRNIRSSKICMQKQLEHKSENSGDMLKSAKIWKDKLVGEGKKLFFASAKT